ncbi:Mitochondrial scaffolding protein 1 [Bienertia sinuspersici]
MDSNDDESKTKPLISSMKPQKEGVQNNLNKEEDDESTTLLSPRNGEISDDASKTKRKVQWNDKLAEILIFQPRCIGVQGNRTN